MSKKEKMIQRLMSCILSFILVLTTIHMTVSAATSGLEKQVLLFENDARVRIMQMYSDCTWTDETTIACITPLYDPYGEVNGYIFEYDNGETPAGFMQIDISLGTPYRERFGFVDEHYAASALRQESLQKNLFADSCKIAFLGGYDYYLVDSFDTDTVAYNIGKMEKAESEYTSKAAEYDTFLSTRQEALALSSTLQSTAISRASTGEKWITGFYQYFTLASYANTGAASNECAILSALSSAKYWGECRGKSGVYSSIPATYRAIKPYITIDGATGVSTSLIPHNGYYNYLTDNGFTVTTTGRIYYANFTFAKIMEIIDRNIPITVPSYASTSLAHAVTVFGYNADDITMYIGDGNTTRAFYQSYYPQYQVNNSNFYSYYVG